MKKEIIFCGRKIQTSNPSPKKNWNCWKRGF